MGCSTPREGYEEIISPLNRYNNQEDNHFSSMDDDSTSAKQLAWLLYILGMIGMSFINPFFCVLAMKYANPSILAPFSGLTLVWIICFSGMILNELPNRRQKVACALIVAGEVIVALFGDHVNGVDGGIEGVVRIRM